ncbi:MAG: Na/Pi cotransporter family protein [Muribaculaceae bacterium]|nr:Na/Pi cotransporter family protein [Muribaculaceae bacterium]
MGTTQQYAIILLKILGTLGLLIFGMRMMSTALQKMAGPQLRHVLGRMTTNRFMGMLTGTGVTCAVQSSSATTVMTVSFVSAGLLTLGQAISVIMGANIGTTLTAWIMSLGYNVDLTNVVFPAFLVGILLIYHKRHRYKGDFLFGIAFMFFSLVLLSSAGKELDLEHNEAVMRFFSSFDTGSHFTILIFLAIGTVITCIVQSSAAVMAITILLCSTGVLPIYLGIALVMGENIGTTATANLAALGANTEARRAALAHLLFNVFGVIWVVCIFYPFVDMVCHLVGYDPSAGGQRERLPIVLAMFHTCFNVTNTALLIGFIPQIEKVVRWMLPDKEKDKNESFKLLYIKANLIQTPEIAVMQAQKETAHFGRRAQDMFGLVQDIINEKNGDRIEELFQQIEQDENYTDEAEINIARFLEQVSDGHLSDDSKMKVRQMLREIGEIESIGDSCYRLARTARRCKQQGEELDATMLQHLHEMTALCDNALSQMNIVLEKPLNDHDLETTYTYENQLNTLRDRFKSDNAIAIDEHQYKYALGTAYGELLGELEKLGDYVVNVVEARFGK